MVQDPLSGAVHSSKLLIQARCFGLTISVWKALEGISHIIFPKKKPKKWKDEKKSDQTHTSLLLMMFSPKSWLFCLFMKMCAIIIQIVH